MPGTLEPNLFSGLSVYQDVTLAGQTVLRGARDCPGRWEILAPHLPQCGAILDVGSNFGWFGLQLCQRSPDCVVASVEADPRSAAVQHRVLESYQHRRMALLTRRADVRMINTFARAGQRFDAALCLSILHWLPDHRDFLARLGRITSTLLIEQPHPAEDGAGIKQVAARSARLVRIWRSCFLIDRSSVWPSCLAIVVLRTFARSGKLAGRTLVRMFRRLDWRPRPWSIWGPVGRHGVGGRSTLRSCPRMQRGASCSLRTD